MNIYRETRSRAHIPRILRGIVAEIAKLEPRQKKSRKCLICGKPVERQYRPFCSKRCADIDLNRWLSGVYRIETEEKPEEKSDDARRGPAEEPPEE